MSLDAPVSAAKADTGTIDLSVRGLTKTFGQAAAVFSGLDFDIGRGASVALVGANGSGKSTLLRCCLGLIPVDSGAVHLLGQEPARLGRAAQRRLRARTGLVAQKHNLVPRLSVLSNVVHGLLGSGSGPRYWSHAFAPAEARDAAMQALTKVGLPHLANRRADGLSGGQSQRVAIARALVCKPRFLIADEPTASLDPAAGEEVMDLFFDLVRADGVTVVFTSHNVDHALRYGDRVLGLAHGRLEIDTTTQGLKSHDLEGLYV